MRAVAVIPARYASTRLFGKPLLDICGKPLIRRVWDVVTSARGLDAVIVATDDTRIADTVRAFGGEVRMTSPECQSGSDRVCEVAALCATDVYVNIQGDEPLLEPAAIETLLTAFVEDNHLQVATLCCRISQEQALCPHQVKVVRDQAHNALYFSRSPIPFARESDGSVDFLGHIGIYAYTAEALRTFASLPPSPLEQVEKLEQLRFLQAGIAIRVLEVPPMGAGVDTPEDLERVRTVLRERRRAAALRKLKHIRMIITDVDGVLTDGGLYYGADGECLKRFHARDGMGTRLLQQAGIQLAVLSGRDCPALRCRLAELDITCFVLGLADKRGAILGLMECCGVTATETAFIGDDIPDMEVFDLCGVSVTVGDAPDCVKAKADLVLDSWGGQGALRELTDLLLLGKNRQ